MHGHYNEVSLNNERRNISAFFGWMADNGYIDRNPVRRIEKIKEKKSVKKPLKDTEIEMLKRHARNDIRTIALIEVLLSTACRVSEVVGMNREDIDGDEIVVRGKGNKERVVFLNAKALVALDEYLQSRDDDNPALFVSMDEPHERLKASGIEIILRRLGRECGIEKVHPHRFRRTSATQALNKGMDIEQIAQMMGHDSIETTKIYAKSSKENVKASHARYLG
jgi:integrase/recombinase XerD